METFWEEYSLIIGLLVLAVVCIIFFSSPEDIFRSAVAMDTSMYHKTQYERLVFISYDFYNQSDLERFPKIIYGWESREFEPTEWELEVLRPKVLLLREYSMKYPIPNKPKHVPMKRTIKFVLIHSGNMSSFHDPKICYKANGWNVTDRGVEAINMSFMTGELPYLNKILIQQGSMEEVVLYWYMWGQGVPRDKKNSIMIRISTPTLFGENESIDILKDFAGELFPEMFKPKTRSSIMAIQVIEKFGVFGFILDALILAVPFFIMLRYRKRS